MNLFKENRLLDINNKLVKTTPFRHFVNHGRHFSFRQKVGYTSLLINYRKQRYIKSRDLNLLLIINIFSHYDRRIGQSGADR